MSKGSSTAVPARKPKPGVEGGAALQPARGWVFAGGRVSDAAGKGAARGFIPEQCEPDWSVCR